MSAPSDGARADARKRLAAEVVAPDERIAAVLSAHRFDFGAVLIERDSDGAAKGYTLGCSCGEFRYSPGPDAQTVLEAHVIAALAGVIADAKAEVREQIAMEIEAKAAGNHAAFAADEDGHLIRLGERYAGEWKPTYANRHDDGCGMCGLASAARIARGDS